MKFHRKIVTAMLCLQLLADCAGAGIKGQSMFQGNPQHTGVYDAKPIYRFSGIKFAFKTEGPVRSSPVIANGNLYFGSGDNYFYCIDAQSGTERWRFKTNGAVHSSPACADGRVYFTSRDRNLYALDALSGKEVWKFTMGNDLPYRNGFEYYLSSPIVLDDRLYVGSGDGNLYSLQIQTKKLLWKYAAGSRIRVSPAVAGDLVLVGTMDGYLLAINKASGELKWKFATLGTSLKIEDFGYDRSAIVSSPSIADGIVTFGCRDGFLYAVDLETGKQKWSCDHKISWVISTPAVEGGRVYVGSSDGQFFQSVDHSTGRELWRFTTGGPVWSSAAVVGPLVYFASNDGNVFALNKETGSELWHFKTNDRIFSSPAVTDGVLFCGSDDGYVYGLMGSVAPENISMQPRKAVFWESEPTTATKWFAAGTDEWIRDYFMQQEYEVLDSKGLADFMKEQLIKKSKSVVILADHRVPRTILKEESENALIRQYLNAGGKIVWLGMNPLAYVRDTTGMVLGLNFGIPTKVLGIRFPGNQLEGIGWYASTVTAEGRAWGLRGWWVGLGWVNPTEVTTVLARDENGMASAWVKNYGGPEGTGLVQLWIPRDKHIDLYPVKLAAEYGIR